MPYSNRMKISFPFIFILIWSHAIVSSWTHTTINHPMAQLIYEFSAKFKYINRISILTCHRPIRNWYSDQAHNQTTFTTRARTNALIDNLTLVQSLFKAEGILIKVLAIDTVSAFWSTMASRTEYWKSFLQSEDHRQVVLLNLSCGNNSLEILELASNEQLFNSSFHWLLIDDRDEDDETYVEDVKEVKGEWKDYGVNRSVNAENPRPTDSEYGYKEPSLKHMQLIEFLSKLNFNMNTELMLAEKIVEKDKEAGSDYVLHEIWNPGLHYGGKLNITRAGQFSQRDGLQMDDWFRKTPLIVRRADMKNALIRCMFVITSRPTGNWEDFLRSQRDRHLDSMHRFSYVILCHLMDMFNFRIHLSQINSWGYSKNGTFDGMIGALVRRQADIGGSPAFFRKERALVIDYTAGTWIPRPCFIFRHPSTTSLMRTSFLQPFSNHVWLCIGFCGLLTILFHWKLKHTEENLFNEISNEYSTDTMNSRRKLARRRRQQNSQHHKLPDTTGNKLTNGVRQHNCNLENFLPSFLGCRHKSKLAIVLKRFFEKFLPRDGSPVSKVSPMNANPKFQNGMYHSNLSNGNDDVASIIPLYPSFRDADHLDGLSQDNCRNLSHSVRGFVKTMGILQSCVMFFIAAICQQGAHYSCHLLSGRVAILSTLLFAFCISQFYSGTIVGTQLMEKPKTMKTIPDLIDSSLKIIIEEMPYTRDYFQRTTDPDAIELYWRKMSQPVDNDAREGRSPDTNRQNGRHCINNENDRMTMVNSPSASRDCGMIRRGYNPDSKDKFDGKMMKKGVADVMQSWMSMEEGLKLMKTGAYAFHVELATAYKVIRETFTEQEICELTEIQLFPPQEMGGIVQKGSPLRKMITYGLQRTTETGLMDRQRKLWHSQKPPCVRQIQPINFRVGMETCSSALFLLILGLVASGVILALEVMYDLWQRRSIASKSPNIGQEWNKATNNRRQIQQHKRRRSIGGGGGRQHHRRAFIIPYSTKDNVGEKDIEFVN